MAEWSKAVDSGSIPKGRGFKSRPQHFFVFATNKGDIFEYYERNVGKKWKNAIKYIKLS